MTKTTLIGEYALAPVVSMRVNNIPCMTPPAHAQDIEDAVHRLRELIRWNKTSRDRLCQMLYEVAHRIPADVMRRVVLPLKRDIYNGRATRISRDDVVARVTTNPEVLHWFSVQSEAKGLHAKIARLHASQCEQERSALQNICRNQRFQQALTMSSRTVYRAALAYGRTPPARHGSKLRRSEPRLLQYAARAATRTSPFSLYTSVATGAWSEAIACEYPIKVGSDRASSVVVNHALVRRFLDAVVRHKAVASLVAYRLGPCVQESDARVAYDIQHDDAERQPRVFRGTERRGSMRRTALLHALIQWLRSAPRPFKTIVDQIARHVGSAQRTQIEAFVDQLIACGLLVPYIPIPEQCDGILDDAAKFLDTIELPLCRDLAALVRRADDVLTGFDVAAPADRAVRLTRLDGFWQDAFRAVAARPPTSVIAYEDSVVSARLDLHPVPWAPIINDLRRLLPALEVFDFKWYLKAVLKNEFVARHGHGGRCNNLDELARLMPTVYDRLFMVWRRDSSETIEREDPTLAVIANLRARLTDAFLTATEEEREELTLDEETIDGVASRRPDQVRRDWTSYSAFVQASVRNGAITQAVVNSVYGGLGTFVSRFAGVMGSVPIETLRQRVRQFFPGHHLVAEFRPVRGFNANLHEKLTPQEIGDIDLGSGEAVAESDLRIRHDIEDDEIVVTHAPTGKRVDLAYLGVLVPYLLPIKYGALFALGGSGQINLPFHPVAEQRLDPAARARIRRYPRVRFGSVVISRRRWYAPKSGVPRQGTKESDPAYLVRLNHWRLDAGIPPLVFVRDHPSTLMLNAVGDAESWRQRFSWTRGKPQFIDFRHALFVRYLAKWLLRDPDHDLFFEEVLPTFASSVVREDSGPRVAEVVIEFDRRASSWSMAQ